MATEAQVKNTKNTPTTETKTEKVVKPKVLTIASVFRDLAQKGAKDRKELATKILAELKSKGMNKNVRGYEIKEERVSQQISAMIRDINMERGKDKKSWWSQYKVVEGDTLKIVKKD